MKYFILLLCWGGCASLLSAQPLALKIEAGAIYTGNFTLEVEKMIGQRIGIFVRGGMVKGPSARIGEERSFPLPSGFLVKAGPQVHLSERWSIRGEVAYCRTQLPDQNPILLDLNEIHSGFGLSLAYKIPIHQRIFLEVFGGIGQYSTRQIARIKAEGFGNDSYLVDRNVKLASGSVSPIHLVIHGERGMVGGLNLGFDF